MFNVHVHWATFFGTSVPKAPAARRRVDALLQHNLWAKTAVQMRVFTLVTQRQKIDACVKNL